MVFCGLYPVEPAEYEPLKQALEKLSLNDAAFTYEPETSQALGFGFRCGFLGLLHMEIIQERLEREFQAKLIATAPSVIYKVLTVDGEEHWIDNPSKLPDPTETDKMFEPFVRMEVHVPDEHVGAVLALCEEKRGNQKNMQYHSVNRVVVTYELPFSEIMYDFFDRLKSSTRGYASLDYEVIDYREADLVKLDVLINTDPVDAFSCIVHRETAPQRGKGPGPSPQAGHSQTALRGRHPGGHRTQDRGQGAQPPLPKERDRQVLRRRHFPQAQASGKAEGRQAADEEDGQRGDSPGGLSGRPEGRRGLADRPKGAICSAQAKSPNPHVVPTALRH